MFLRHPGSVYIFEIIFVTRNSGTVFFPKEVNATALIAQDRRWTSLGHPDSNSGYPATVRTESQNDPERIFMSIWQGSQDRPGIEKIISDQSPK
jgi:hypothetical protein